jgi:DNA-binding CsgD family transcriptional regulator
MSYREIAETMGLNEGTVKTRLYRARIKLAHHARDTARNTLPRHALSERMAVIENAA